MTNKLPNQPMFVPHDINIPEEKIKKLEEMGIIIIPCKDPDLIITDVPFIRSKDFVFECLRQTVMECNISKQKFADRLLRGIK